MATTRRPARQTPAATTAPTPAGRRPRQTASDRALDAARAKARAALPKPLDAENWDQRLGFLMHDVSRLRRTVFDDFVRPLGVTRSQWWVLAHLARHDGMIQSDLAKVLDLGKAALGGLVDRLEATELIIRRPDEIDGRAKRVFVSTKGYALIAKLRGASHAMSERMLKGISPAKRHALVELLTAVRHNLVDIKAESGAEDGDAD
ncbi:MAG: MarR family transcriptional regulator [Proteobacteria bacterium]|nr:MarR family transcriptional regulator [Pseudomonadota bacterium]